MIHVDPHEFKYIENLEEIKEEGYVPVKCFSVLAFYTLKGRVTKLLKENLEPIRFLYYALYDHQVKKYYLKFANPYPVDTLYFYRRSLNFSGDDIVVSNLRKWVEDGAITMLFTKPQIEAITAMLERLWKSQFKTEGKVDYRLYLELLALSLDLEDYTDIGKNLVGYRTVIHSYEVKIADVWKRIETKNIQK